MRNILLRYIACALMCMVMTCLYGQEKFDEQLTAITQMTKEQAIYQLEQYQLAHPQFAGVYYHLGIHSEDLLATIHPILNYDYLIRVLYNVRVYYGNCIHYAQNSSLKDEDFVGIPTQGKKIAYEDIMRFAREKLNRVKQTKTLVDNLYNNYNRMVERYSVCRRMFTEFCELYPSEKQAHLRLQQQDVALLNQLAMQFDSLQLDIKAFEHSLQQYPIEGYHPTFIYNKIQLYRLDGLTQTNFMESAIPLWNYGEFAKQFLTKQSDEYDTYYQAIKHEYSCIDDAIHKVNNGEKQAIKTNKILTNYINKMDYASFMVPLTQIQQMCAELIQCHAQGLFLPNDSIIQDDIELALNTLYEKYQKKKTTSGAFDVLQSRVTDIELDKYKQVLGSDTTIQSILALAQQRLEIADSMYSEISKQFYNAIDETFAPFEHYRDALTDMVIFAHQLPQEGADIVSVLPLGENYLLVYANGVFIVINPQLIPIHQFECKQHLPIKAAYKISGNNIALVSPSCVFFVDQQGKEK